MRERLVISKGHLPFNLATEPSALADMAVDLGVGALLLDAAKDTGLLLSSEEGGAAFNDALQALVQADVQVAFDHHQRKPNSDNKRPKTLGDVYGSTWVTAGCGSVLLLWGEAGDPVIELTHLKQPADVIGPLTVVLDQRRGTAGVDAGGHARMVDVVRERGGHCESTGTRCTVRSGHSPTRWPPARAPRSPLSTGACGITSTAS